MTLPNQVEVIVLLNQLYGKLQQSNLVKTTNRSPGRHKTKAIVQLTCSEKVHMCSAACMASGGP